MKKWIRPHDTCGTKVMGYLCPVRNDMDKGMRNNS